MYDLLIKNGKVISGAGNPWYLADVAVKDGVIVRIGHIDNAGAERTIDAAGLFVAPGFIDGHSHSDLFLLANPKAEQKIMQGITTENIGLDGLSVAPINETDIPDWRTHLSGLAGNPPLNWKWRSLADHLDAVDESKPSINVSSYVGLGAVRLKVMGMTTRPATPEEIERMKREIAEAMEQGARGVSTGLIYPPCVYQSKEEMAALCQAAAQYGGIFDVHLRSESDNLLEAIDEVVDIGRRSGIAVHITHFKSMGRDNWGKAGAALEKIDRLRTEGLDITLAQYPYTAGSTMLHAILPPWFHAEGPEKMIDRLANNRRSVKEAIYENFDWENYNRKVEWEDIFISSVESEANKKYEGKHLIAIASEMGLTDPVDAACNLLVDEKLAVGMVTFCMSEEDVIEIMKHPTVCFITDGLLGGAKPHPRVYGSMPRILGRYVREKRVLSLEEAVRKMTSASAQRLGLRGKGLIEENYDADITIFNAETVIDKATYEEPRQFPEGISFVIVNGEVVVENGRHTGASPGKTIR